MLKKSLELLQALKSGGLTGCALATRGRLRSMILFTADWHIKLGQKNVPMAWACTRLQTFL